MLSMTVKGADVVRRKNNNRQKALSANGKMGRMVEGLGTRAYTLLRQNAHRQTGAMYRAITLKVNRRGSHNVNAQVYLNPTVKNPRSKGRPADYAKFENARGGSHAFFDKTARAMKGTEMVAIRELTRIVVEGAGA